MFRSQPVSAAASIADLRLLAQRRVPKAFFEFADHGSYSQATMAANRADLEALKLRQRVAIDVGTRDLSTTLLGETLPVPLALAPIGLCGMQYGDGEIHAYRAAAAAGIPFCLSTMAIGSIEDVAAAGDKPFWFQLHILKDRGFVRDLIQRAIAAGCSALVPALDIATMGQRHSDIRNGMTIPPRIGMRNFFDFASRPGWMLGIARGKRRIFGNIAGHVPGIEDTASLMRWAGTQLDPSVTWNDIEWVRQIWPGEIILKGILDPEDARIAAKIGVSGIVVSNHGGRQLDGAPSTISALPKVAEAVGDRLEILFDGGIRSGQDVMRALALGARCCLIGRAFVYGLGAGGQAGVARAIEIIRRELDATMALAGIASVRAIGPDVLARAGTHFAEVG